MNIFKNDFFGILSECQKVWTQIRNDVLSVPICIQNVIEGNQQTTKVVASKERVVHDGVRFLKI